MSRYKIKERDDGFVISGEDRVTTHVKMRETGIDVWHGNPTNRTRTPPFGLFQYYDMTKYIAGTLMREWRTKEDRANGSPPTNLGRNQKIKEWAVRQTGKAIGKMVHAQWKRLLDKANPGILDVQRAVFAVSFRCNYDLRTNPNHVAYRDRWLHSDVLNYRAAAAALHWYRGAPELLGNWMELYSPPQGRGTYRALRRTLMNLPGGVPCMMLENFQAAELPRAIFDRVELIATLTAATRLPIYDPIIDGTYHQGQWQEVRDKFELVAMTPRHKLIKAMDVVYDSDLEIRDMSKSPASPARYRKAGVISRAINHILDCPGVASSLVRQARDSIDYHRHFYRPMQQLYHGYTTFDRSREVALPPIELPDDPRITFLRTVGDIHAEGERMKHCVAGYDMYAVGGNSYLFHVEYNGEQATIEVKPQGYVNGASGPCNTQNYAVEYGKSVLGKWAQGLKNGAGLQVTPGFGLHRTLHGYNRLPADA